MPRAVAVLVIEGSSFGHVDGIGQHGHDESYEGTQNPTLCAVPQDIYTAPEVLPASEGLDPVGIGDAVVHPVGRGELIIPHTIVRVDRSLGFGHQCVLAVGKSVDQTLTPRIRTAVVTSASDAICITGNQHRPFAARNMEGCTSEFNLPA